jgi:hypothetical protein
MVERSRSGAYIPVGKMQRSQSEATSPWSFAEKAKRLHAEDFCPDCAAEQRMKKLESVKTCDEILKAASHFHGSAQPPPQPPGPEQLPTTASASKLESVKARDDILQAASHFHGSPQPPPPGPKELPTTDTGSKPVPTLDVSNELESSKVRDDILQAASHFHGSPQPPPPVAREISTTASGSKPVATSDFFNDTGVTVVVQHEGILDRLIIDPRRGPLTRASTQRLSENLAKVSRAVAQLGSVDEHPVEETNADAGNPQIDRTEPQPLRSPKIRSCSMSELLEDLHAIAAGMNLDISDPTKSETSMQIPSNVTPIQPTYNSYDADELLSEPTTPGPALVNLSHTAESHEEPHYICGLTPGQSLPHGENPESLLSEPTSPGPMSDTALGEAIAAHARNQVPIDNPPSPPSVYSTALSTRNNSIQGPIHLPSSILRATDYFPISTNTPTQRPFSRTVASPLVRTMSRFAPGHYPSTPTLPSPWSVQSPKPTKRVRAVDRWPHEHETTTEPDPAHIATELQKAVQEVAARERDLHMAVREAAEMERVLRRRVRARGGLGGEVGGAK